MFEEISIAMKAGLFAQAKQIGKDWEHHFAQKDAQKNQLLLEQYIQTYNNIIHNFNATFTQWNDQFNAAQKEQQDIHYHTEKMKKAYYTLLLEHREAERRHQTMLTQQQHISRDVAMRELTRLNQQLEDVRQCTREISRRGAIYMQKLNNLSLDVFYVRAATYADNKVHQFLRYIIVQKARIDNLDAHEINVFATAYEDYVTIHHMTHDPQWRTRLSIALDERANADTPKS